MLPDFTGKQLSFSKKNHFFNNSFILELLNSKTKKMMKRCSKKICLINPMKNEEKLLESYLVQVFAKHEFTLFTLILVFNIKVKLSLDNQMV